jgi:ribonuclease HII
LVDEGVLQDVLEPETDDIERELARIGRNQAVEDELARLKAAGATIPSFTIEPKADGNYPICGAASIFAKVHRDAAIAALGPVGSGYPSDPTTRAWLSEFLRTETPFPDCVRTRWATIENLRASLADQP